MALTKNHWEKTSVTLKLEEEEDDGKDGTHSLRGIGERAWIDDGFYLPRNRSNP